MALADSSALILEMSGGAEAATLIANGRIVRVPSAGARKHAVAKIIGAVDRPEAERGSSLVVPARLFEVGIEIM